MTAPGPSEWDVNRVLNWGTALFRQRGIEQPRISIEWLLGDVLGLKRFDLYLQFDRPITKDELAKLRSGVERRLKGEPLQYISGHTDFYHCRIQVTPDVLIPRPETEELVEIVLKREPVPHLSALDIGTGSGCIAIALKKERPGWNLFGMDISEEALKVARNNASLNAVEVTFFKMDMRNAYLKKPQTPLDIIVSNPPYIPVSEKDTIDAGVFQWEPHKALLCSDPLEYYSAIRDAASTWLSESGRVYLELNDTHAEAVKNLFFEAGYMPDIFTDLNNKPRFLRAVKKAD
jgi:release factor glutamine methyltransferase